MIARWLLGSTFSMMITAGAQPPNERAKSHVAARMEIDS
jgi:hypothetical protein